MIVCKHWLLLRKFVDEISLLCIIMSKLSEFAVVLLVICLSACSASLVGRGCYDPSYGANIKPVEWVGVRGNTAPSAPATPAHIRKIQLTLTVTLTVIDTVTVSSYFWAGADGRYGRCGVSTDRVSSVEVIVAEYERDDTPLSATSTGKRLRVWQQPYI